MLPETTEAAGKFLPPSWPGTVTSSPTAAARTPAEREILLAFV
jgi:hypothetical protein